MGRSAKTNVGVIIGRFQVPELTEAHHALIDAVWGEQDTAVLLLGVSPTDGFSAENPLTFAQRSTLFANISGPLMVFPLADCTTDEMWSRSVDALLQSTFPPDRYHVTLYGGRKSFRESYRGQYPCKDVELNIPVSGTDVRAAVKEASNPTFLAGQVYALQTQFPKVYPTVDCIVWRKREASPVIEVLLIQRADNGEWGFIGGFVDPQDESYARACSREVYEEVGLSNEHGLTYLGSCRVNDWRYRGTRDTITTTVFAMQYAFGPVKINPEEVQDYQWMPAPEVLKHLSPTHVPLWSLATNWLASL